MFFPAASFRVWLFTALLTLCGFAPLRAQNATPTPSGPLQMTLATPFALTAKPLVIQARAGRWFPVAVKLSNTGEAVSGDVRLRLTGTDFEFAPNEYHAPVDLPSNSNKIVWLYGRMERADIRGIQVSFSGRGFSQLTQRAAISEPEPEQRLATVISDSNDGLADTLKSLMGQALFRSGAQPTFNPNAKPVRPFQAPRDLVPDRWIGFDGADMVVLGDFPHISLAPPQIEALRGYVLGGGNLIVVGGGNAARLASSPLRDLWPQKPVTSASASSTEVAGLVDSYVANPKNGADRLGGTPVQIVRGPLQGASILKAGTAQAPLFALRDSGAGRTLMLSYDPAQPPFRGWSGQGELWRDVFTNLVPARRLDSVDGDLMAFGSGMTPGMMQTSPNFNTENGPNTATGRLLQGLSRAPQLRMPPVSQIAWFLALYVFFLVPVNYAILRFVDRRELAWVTIPAIVAVFSIWAYSAALSIRGRAILTRQVDVVQASVGSTRGRSDAMLWLFSPKRTTYDLVSTGQSAALADYANTSGGRQGSFGVLQPPGGESFKVEGANVWMWTDRAFSAQSLVDLGRGVSLRGNTLQNGTPFDLQGAAWIQDRSIWSLGTLKKGSSTTIQGAGVKLVSAEMSGALGRASKLNQIFDASTNSNGIPTQVISAILGSNFGRLNGEATLIAWGKKPVAAMEVEGARGADVTLWVIRAPRLTGSLAAREAQISRVSFEPFTANPGPNGGGGFAFYDCLLPQQSKLTLRARGTGLKPFVASNAPGNVPPPPSPGQSLVVNDKSPDLVRFEVWNSTRNAWQTLAGKMRRDKSPDAGWNFEAPIQPNWARQPDRLLRLRVRLDKPPTGNQYGGSSPAQVSTVTIS